MSAYLFVIGLAHDAQLLAVQITFSRQPEGLNSRGPENQGMSKRGRTILAKLYHVELQELREVGPGISSLLNMSIDNNEKLQVQV